MNNVKLECNRHQFEIDQRYCIGWDVLLTCLYLLLEVNRHQSIFGKHFAVWYKLRLD